MLHSGPLYTRARPAMRAGIVRVHPAARADIEIQLMTLITIPFFTSTFAYQLCGFG